MTPDVKTHLQLEADLAQNALLRRASDQTQLFICLLSGPDFVFAYYNHAYHELIGHRDLLGLPVDEALPEIAGQGFVELLKGVYTTGVPFVGREVPVELRRNETLETRFATFVYEAIRGPNGEVEGILATGSDVTAEVKARQEASELAIQLQQRTELVEARVAERTRELERQRELTARIIDHAPTGMSYLNRDLRYEWVNPQQSTYWGIPSRAIIGRTVQEVFGPETDAQVGGILRGVIASGEPYSDTSFPFRYIFEDEERWSYWDFTYQPVKDDDGEVQGILVMATEVSDRKRRQDLMSLQNRVLEMVATETPLPVIMDGIARLVEMQKPGVLCSILLLEGDRLRHGAAPSLPEGYNRQIDGIAIGPSVGSCGTAAHSGETVVVSDITTDPRWADFKDLAAEYGLRACWSVPILAADGTVLGTFAQYHRKPKAPDEYESQLIRGAAHLAGIAIERQRAREALARHLEELETANESLQRADHYKDEFLSVISHELRTPLNFIMGFASTLDDEVQGPLNDRQHEAIGKILNGADRMLLLVNDLLDFARMQAGKFNLEPRPVDYDAVLREAVATLEPMARQKGVKLLVDAEVGSPWTLDAARVTQILTNLVGNGIKFTPAGGMVALRAFIRDGKLVTEVADTGCGIAPEYLPKVFNKFEQFDMSATRQAGGTGLGLAIARSLVEVHGGEIDVRSRLGEGTTFWFSLPA